MQIKTVSIIGLGALGILFGKRMADSIGNERVRIIADARRIEKYRQEGIYCNGQLCDFAYMPPDEACEPADLAIFAVKFSALEEAAAAMKRQIGPKTLIMSLLNGISSEGILGEQFGMENILYCIAQGMDAVKEQNRLTYTQMGKICFGESPAKTEAEKAREAAKTKAVAEFFQEASIPHELVPDVTHMLWSKFMLNVGVNQVVACYEGSYGTIQAPGEARAMMLEAMAEVMKIAPHEGITLTEEDVNGWMKVLSTLSPDGKPSLRQDTEAGRKSEVELFAGTVRALGKKHGVRTPVNDRLYAKIKAIEAAY